jgi:glyoxylase-like metal-dependent hydrolase (beta-lactamase superfamily II)
VSVKAYAIPGHTQGSGAFLINETLFLGDSAGGQSDGKVRGAPWVFSDNTEQNRASVRALAQRLKAENSSVKTLAFAHSGPLNGLEPLLNF